ncbi:MAG: glycosyltransferase [Gammaproteobacteria bacterium]|nr:glycosyltransferase [Gammaproteobacteria bacterium]
MTATTNFVVPCFNAEDTLRQCIEGIQACTGELDLVVVDNGSTDQSIQIARSTGCDVISAPHENVGGVRNVGAGRGQGDFIAFIDSDCVLPTNWLETGLPYFSDNNVAMVGAYHYVPSERNNWVEEAWSFHMISAAQHGEVDWLPTRALLVRRSAFEETGGFDPALVSCEDADLGYRLSKRFKIIAVPELAPVHLEDPQSLRELFFKERWRGASGLKVALRNLSRLSEIRSLLVAVYYLLFTALLPVSLAWAISKSQTGILVVNILLLLIPAFLIASITSIRNGSLRRIPALFAVFLTYFFARALALIWRS